MKGDARREQILDTAVDLFSKHGFKGTTTKQIAQAAGVSEAMVFRHFASKDELYQAILDRKTCPDGQTPYTWQVKEELADAIERKDDNSVFYYFALEVPEKQAKDVNFLRLMLYSALEDHGLAERFYRDFVEKTYAFFSDYIVERQRDGVFREMSPRLAVRAFMGMFIHHSLNNLLWDKKRTLLDVGNEEAATAFADILLNGIRKR